MIERPSSLLCAAILLVLGCETSPAPDVHPEQLAKAFSSLLLSREEWQSHRSTLTAEQYQSKVDSLLVQNGFTRETFYKTLQQIAREPAAFRSFAQNASELLVASQNR